MEQETNEHNGNRHYNRRRRDALTVFTHRDHEKTKLAGIMPDLNPRESAARCPPLDVFSFVTSPVNYHPPFDRLTPRPSPLRRQRDAPGNFVHAGGNRVRDRHPTAIWVNWLPGNDSVSSSYALSPANYVVRNAGSHHRFLSVGGYPVRYHDRRRCSYARRFISSLARGRVRLNSSRGNTRDEYFTV